MSFRAFVQVRRSRVVHLDGARWAPAHYHVVEQAYPFLHDHHRVLSRERAIGRGQQRLLVPAGRAYEAQEPADESRESVLEPGHESDVHDEPDEPRDSAREPHFVRAEDGAATVHGGHASEVQVLPGSRLGTVSDAVSDDAGGMETGQPLQRPADHRSSSCRRLRTPRVAGQ